MITINICKQCGKEFEVFPIRARRNAPAQEYCPTCNDTRQERPSVIVKREVLALIDGVRIGSLPGQWQEFQATRRDYPSWRMVARGDQYGEDWNGVILIHATRPFVAGEVCRLRHMRATRRVKRATWLSPTSGWGEGRPTTVGHVYDFPPTMPNEAIYEMARAGGVLAPSAGEAMAAGDFSVAEEVIDQEYVVLESPRVYPSAANRTMVWMEVTSKTTQKGFGAQYKRTVDLSGADWVMEIDGGTRNRRWSTRGILAVVPDGRKIVVRSAGHGGGGDTAPYTWTKEYPLHARRERQTDLESAHDQIVAALR